MSTVQDSPQRAETPRASGEGRLPRPRDGQDGKGRDPRRRRTVLVTIAALVALGGAGAVTWTARGGVAVSGEGNTTRASSVGPVALPTTLLGMTALSKGDVTASSAWTAKAKRAGTAVAGRTFGAAGTARSLRLVAGRTDLAGKLELAWAADQGQAVGDVRCTNNLRFNPSSPASIRQTVILCWRTSATLSVYALVIDPKAVTAIPATEGATAVDTVWTMATRG